MKVGTDSVLLGAWVNLNSGCRVLDIGTGCGILALMAAQRGAGEVVAIEIDEIASSRSVQNFMASPWKEKITGVAVSLQKFATNHQSDFDLIITNPPYFVNSLKAPEARRKLARHNDELPFETLAGLSSQLLRSNGRLALILPLPEAADFQKFATLNNLHLIRSANVIPVEGKSANRMLLEFSKTTSPLFSNESITIRKGNNEYTEEYRLLTRDFYLSF